MAVTTGKKHRESTAKLSIILDYLQDEIWLRDQLPKCDNWQEQVALYNVIKLTRLARRRINDI
jgi:hypothetical protein